jgi:ADP-ribose pyrophosphatase YjhB (NUDIX family)
MDFVVRKTVAPEFAKEVVSDAENIARGLDYDDDVGMVKYVDGKKMGIYFMPFSLCLALKRNGMKAKGFGVCGIVQMGAKYILTTQARKHVESRGVGTVVDVPPKPGLSFQGFALEWEDDPADAAYSELEEELGLERDDVIELKRDIVISDDEALLCVLFKTELKEDVILKLKEMAIDGWEAEKVHFLGKTEAREFLKGTPMLNVFDKLVEK